MNFDATLHIAPDHPAFSGHFPGAPIVPGVVLLDAALHAAMQTLRLAPSGKSETSSPVCQISSVKFLSPVGPDETLKITCASTASGSLRFDISSDSRKVASGTLVLPCVL